MRISPATKCAADSLPQEQFRIVARATRLHSQLWEARTTVDVRVCQRIGSPVVQAVMTAEATDSGVSEERVRRFF